MKKILDKIHALLQRTEGNGASQAEAIEAAKLAQRLMAKYHVEITEYEEQKETIDEVEVAMTRLWNRNLAAAIAANTCCEVLAKHRGRKTAAVFLGKDADRKTAVSMFEMFRSLIKKGAAEARNTALREYGNAANVEIMYAKAYIRAVEDELGKQCRALALVPSAEVTEEMNKRYPNLKKAPEQQYAKSYDIDAVRMAACKGYADGQRAAMRREIGRDTG